MLRRGLLTDIVLAWEAELLKEMLTSTKYPQCKCFNFSLINTKFYLFQNAPNIFPIWFWNEESDFKMFQSYLSIYIGEIYYLMFQSIFVFESPMGKIDKLQLYRGSL